MTEPAVSLVYVTVPDAATAERIGRDLVESGLAACANILPGMRSIYRWQGAVEAADECVLIVKCPTAAVPAATRRIIDVHPYDLPCVIDWPIAGGNPLYLAWIGRAGQ